MWDSIQNLVPKVAGKYSFTRTLKAIEVCQEYRSLAPRLLKTDALNHTFAKSYEKNVLTIGVLNSVWAQKVQMNRHLIQDEINKKYGPRVIANIRIEMAETLPGDLLSGMPEEARPSST